MRKIYLHGEINGAMFSRFSKKIDRLVFENPNAPIDIELASEGGKPYAALAIYNKMRQCDCEISVLVYGPCMSAATIILAGGDMRYMAQDSWFMVHESTEGIKGTLADHRTHTQQMQLEENQWSEILARHSEWTAKQWAKASSRTTYLTAEELYSIKLVHGVLKGAK